MNRLRATPWWEPSAETCKTLPLTALPESEDVTTRSKRNCTWISSRWRGHVKIEDGQNCCCAVRSYDAHHSVVFQHSPLHYHQGSSLVAAHAAHNLFVVILRSLLNNVRKASVFCTSGVKRRVSPPNLLFPPSPSDSDGHEISVENFHSGNGQLPFHWSRK